MYREERFQNSFLCVVLFTATGETYKRDLQKSPAKMTCGQNYNKRQEVQATELRRYGGVATVSRID